VANDTRTGKPQDLLRRQPTAPAALGSADGRAHYAAGDVLFNQGDPGGDLFFIETGTVEIFTAREGEAVVLAEMAQGEIIGIMTCLTSEARMASARAKTDVVCKKVPHMSIKKVLSVMPNWMKIVLKEFTIRLTQMNRTYSEAVARIKKLEQSQLSNVYTGAQIAAAFGAIGEFMAIKSDVGRLVVVEDVMLKLETVLNLKKEDLDRVFQVLLEAGLLKLEIEPDRKRTITKLENAQKLAHFAQFVREAKHGATKKLVRARFSHKETRVLSAMVKLAARLEMDLEKTCKLGVKELERNLEKATGVKFERAALEKAETLKLLAVETSEAGDQVVMKPSHLGRTVACIEAVRKLSALDGQGTGAPGSVQAA
jgi:CRP-like cAMP-binding protein